ncbi:hypothetical protein Clacol_006197 [Clathrus columnatus]|uniref:Uncharacterized protein n=1 Tax=Clathrus columnatus TaxID=1419009 RepID=A0AAV5AFJ3_9AGAM|nr:hypothetical protein Clacol_006197 [Clathrus columnatus]
MNLDSVRRNVNVAHFDSSPRTGAFDNTFVLEDGMFSFYTPIQFDENPNRGSAASFIHSKSHTTFEDGCNSQEDFAVERLVIWRHTGKSTKHISAQTSPDIGQQTLPLFPSHSLPSFYAPIRRFLTQQFCPLLHLAIPPPSQTIGSSNNIDNITSYLSISLNFNTELWLFVDAYHSNTSLGSFRTKMVKESCRNRYQYSASLPDELLKTLYCSMINDPVIESDTLIIMRFVPENSTTESWDDVLFVAVADFIRASGAMMDEIKVHRIPDKISISTPSDTVASSLPPRLKDRISRNYPILTLTIPTEKDAVPVLFCTGPQSSVHLTSSSSMDVPESAIRSPSDSIL